MKNERLINEIDSHLAETLSTEPIFGIIKANVNKKIYKKKGSLYLNLNIIM